MKRQLVNFLCFCLCFCSLFSSSTIIHDIKNHLPNFEIDEESFILPSENENVLNENDSEVSATKAVQRRFRSYSDVDFDKRALHDSIFYHHKKVLYRSFYEYLRRGIMRDSLVFVASLYESSCKDHLSIPLIKYWLMLDKLIKDQAVESSDSLIEYAQLVINMTPDIPGLNIDPDLYKAKIQTLRHAIKMNRPLIIIKSLLYNLKSEITANDTISIFKEIYLMTRNFSVENVLPNEFPIYQAAIKILNPLDWFLRVYNEELNGSEEKGDFLPWLFLSPFYLILSAETDEIVLENLKNVIMDFTFDFDRDNIGILSEFIKITNFCNCPDNYGQIYQQKMNRLAFILGRFEITLGENCEDFLMFAIENNSIGLVEAFLRFDPNLLESDESRSRAIKMTLFFSYPEMAVIISSYRAITSEEFGTIWLSIPNYNRGLVNGSMYISIKFLLQISEEFDGDVADVHEIVNGDRIEHPFPQPNDYERYAKIISFNSGLNVFCIARIILLKYFGVPFTFTRVKTDGDAIPIWLEIASTVNFFLDILDSKHRVVYEEPLLNK